MIQTKTKILIKDNSDFFKASCINSGVKRSATVGSCIKVSVSKMKPGSSLSTSLKNNALEAKQSLQNLLIVQTKAPILRADGSSLHFNFNSGVSILLKKAGTKRQHQLGFKRINTAVPFELKNKEYIQRLKGVPNVIKLAKHLL
jgi:ribosomal protein L14